VIHRIRKYLDRYKFISEGTLPLLEQYKRFQWASGQLTVSGCSEAVLGSLVEADRTLASESIGPIEIGSGAIQSGAIAASLSEIFTPRETLSLQIE